MNNQKSLLLNFDDDRFSNKSQFRSKILVKHPADRAKSRPLSAKKNAEPEILEKKVENLEKKQVLWKERNQVWDKQKKNYEKALQNVGDR